MKKTLPLLALAFCGLAQAGDLTGAIGDGYGFVSRTPSSGGLGLTFDYVKSSDSNAKGSKPEAAGLGLVFSIPVSNVRFDLGGKAMYLDSDGSATAAMLGGRVNLALPMQTELFGQAYWTPDSLASGSVHKVTDYMAGVRWKPIKLVGVEAGWRRFEIEREDSSRSGKAADGAYIGVSVGF